jgi:hypothetical protein
MKRAALAIGGVVLACVLSAATWAAVDVDRIVVVSQVSTEVSVPQEHAWIVVQGYFETHGENSYVTLDVTNAEFAGDPFAPWFGCRTNDGDLMCAIEQDPLYEMEQMASFDFPTPPHQEAWYFRLTLWVDGVPVDSEYFFSGVEAYRP